MLLRRVVQYARQAGSNKMSSGYHIDISSPRATIENAAVTTTNKIATENMYESG